MPQPNVPGGIDVGQTIAELQEVPSGSENLIPQFYLPTEYGAVNYRVTVSQITALVTKASLGLDQVNNTSDLSKPVSGPMQAALNQKLGRTETIPMSQVDGLVDQWELYRLKSEAVPLEEVVGLPAILTNKMDVGASVNIGQVTGLLDALDAKASVSHNHDVIMLNGWTSFIQGLQQSLSIRPTEDVVETMIADAIEAIVPVDQERLVMMDESEAEWS